LIGPSPGSGTPLLRVDDTYGALGDAAVIDRFSSGYRGSRSRGSRLGRGAAATSGRRVAVVPGTAGRDVGTCSSRRQTTLPTRMDSAPAPASQSAAPAQIQVHAVTLTGDASSRASGYPERRNHHSAERVHLCHVERRAREASSATPAGRTPSPPHRCRRTVIRVRPNGVAEPSLPAAQLYGSATRASSCTAPS
jgi:hypothetical protein